MTQFHPGKQYKTRDGKTAGIDEIREGDGALTGWVAFEEGRTKVCWFSNGRMSPHRESELDLIPSAEDAPSCATDDRLDKLEAMVTDLFRQLRGVRGKHKTLFDRVDVDVYRRLDALDREVPTIQAMTSRLDAFSGRIANLASENANSDEELSQRINTIGEASRNLFDDTAKGVANLINKVGMLEDRLQGMPTGPELTDRLDRYAIEMISGKGHVRSLAGDVATMVEGINKRLAKVEQFFPNGGADPGHTMSYSAPRKSLGWFNVYEDRSTGAAHKTRKEADEQIMRFGGDRIACVEIFEGDGL